MRSRRSKTNSHVVRIGFGWRPVIFPGCCEAVAERRVKRSIARTWRQYADQCVAPWRWRMVSRIRCSLRDLLANCNPKLSMRSFASLKINTGRHLCPSVNRRQGSGPREPTPRASALVHQFHAARAGSVQGLLARLAPSQRENGCAYRSPLSQEAGHQWLAGCFEGLQGRPDHPVQGC
jgi:hypothetical protein